ARRAGRLDPPARARRDSDGRGAPQRRARGARRERALPVRRGARGVPRGRGWLAGGRGRWEAEVTPLVLTHDDQRRLAATTEALLSPLAYADADAWRQAVCIHLRELLHADMAMVLLPG